MLFILDLKSHTQDCFQHNKINKSKHLKIIFKKLKQYNNVGDKSCLEKFSL